MAPPWLQLFILGTRSWNDNIILVCLYGDGVSLASIVLNFLFYKYCIFLSQISLSYTIASNYLLHLEEIFWFPVNSSSNLTKRIQTNANKNFSTLMFYRAHIIQNSLRLEIKGTNPQLLPKFYVQKCRRERFFGFEFIIKIYLIEFHKTPLSLSNRF